MVFFASFPSEKVQIEYFSGLTENNLRTIDDLRDLVIDAGHSIVYCKHPLIDGMHGFQNFRCGHPSFLLCQLV